MTDINAVVAAATDTSSEMITVRSAFIDVLMSRQFELGKERGEAIGRANAKSLDISDDYGTSRAVHMIHAKTRKALSQEVKSRNSRRSGDNPGQAFLWTCELLRAFRNSDGTWQGVCVSATYYDV